MATGDRRPFIDLTLSNYLSWAGISFPYNNNSDIIISAPTTWNDAVGYKKVKTLTINPGQTLRITKSPFFIFADEIIGDATSIIDASGYDGASSGTFAEGFARGGTAVSGSARAQAGCGGGILIIVCRDINFPGISKANGGNGYRNTTNGSGSVSVGGQGAFSQSFDLGSSAGSENWGGKAILVTATNKTYLHPYAHYMVSNLTATSAGGGGSAASGRGGSGISEGGIGGGGDGTVNGRTLTPIDILLLATNGCKGGGAGGASVSATGTDNSAGGGGGGAIALFYRTSTVTPTLQANGGTGATGGSSNNGSAGFTYAVEV